MQLPCAERARTRLDSLSSKTCTLKDAMQWRSQHQCSCLQRNAADCSLANLMKHCLQWCRAVAHAASLPAHERVCLKHERSLPNVAKQTLCDMMMQGDGARSIYAGAQRGF
eukprot:1155839-Pelagomonas_calceolata.AAC.21